MTKKLVTLSLSACLSFMAIPSVSAATSSLTLESITKDVTYLASDELKGRASFSPEIAQAADYISQRFSAIGLQPLSSTSRYTTLLL